MSSVIGTLRVNLGLDAVEFQNGLRKSNAGLSKFAKSAGIAMAAVAAAAVTGLAVLTKESLGVIDEQTKLAKSLLTTTKSVQVMARAGELAGVSMSGIEQASKDLQRRLSEASLGGGPAVAMLKMLGLSAEELIALPLDKRIATINKAITDLVPAAGRAAVAAKLFGEEGSIAISRIDPKTIAQATSEVDAFGVAVSEVDAAAIERANDAMSAIGLAAKGFGNQLAAFLAPVLESVARLITGLAIGLGNLRKSISGFFGPQSDLQVATDNLVLAMGDEITQSGLLSTALGTNTTMSVDAAKKKLAEAIARNENVKAIIAERRALALNSDDYASMTKQIGDLGSQLNAQGFPAIDAAVSSRASAFEQTQQALADLLVARDNLLKLPKELQSQLSQTDENIVKLQAAIAAESGGMVTLGDSMVAPIALSDRLSTATAGSTAAMTEAETAAQDYADAMKGSVTGAIEDVGRAFGDLVSRGFKDFKGFVSSVVGSFARMLGDLASMALKNKIMVSLGPGGSVTGSVASAATSSGAGAGLLGGLVGSFGTAATGTSAAVAGTGILGGLGGVGAGISGGFAAGGIGGAISGGVGAIGSGISAGLATGGIAGIGAAIGAALPIIGIGLALFSLFSSKPPISKADFAKIQQGLQLTGVGLLDTGRVGKKAAAELKKAAGGIEEFGKQTQFYFENFFTDSEKRAKAMESLSSTFSKLHIQMPNTAKQFRDIVEGLDLTTKAGRSTYSELLKVAPVFTSVFGAITDAGKSLATAFGEDIFKTREQMNLAMAALNRGATISTLPTGSGVINLGEIIAVTEKANALQGQTASATMASVYKLSQLLSMFQKWDGDGMPEVRAP